MRRGCGTRKPGGVYICCGLSPFGVPLDHFIIDPPLAHEGTTTRAPIVFEKDGHNHLLFWVGEQFYPYPSDFIEEVRRFGASKRVAISFPIERLDEGSMMFFVHRKAIIEHYQGLPEPQYCPKDNPSHRNNMEYCIGHSYQIAPANQGDGRRQIGDTIYEVYPADAGATGGLEFKPGVFLRLPVTHIDHVLKNGQPHPSIRNKETKVPVNYTDE